MHRFHPSVFAAAFVAVAAVSVPRAVAVDVAAGRADRPRIKLTFVDFVELPARLLAAAQAETVAIVERLGVDVDVRTVPPGEALEPEELTLIVMKGAPAQLTPGVMGAVQRGSSSRVLWVFPANVAAGMRLDWSKRSHWSAREREGFAVAMARVAVHEVVHLVCPWREHDQGGLMAGVLGHSTLTGFRLALTRELSRDFALGVDSMGSGAVSAVRRASVRPE